MSWFRPVRPHHRALMALVALAMASAVVPSLPAAAQDPSHSIQLVHAIPRGLDPTPGVRGAAPGTMAAVQDFLAQDVGRRLRVADGVRVARFDNGSTLSIRDQLVDAGMDDPDTIYLVFAESPGSADGCGVTLYDSAKPTFSFLLMPVCNIYPQANDVWPFGATYLVLHELLHAMGAVPTCAPNFLAGGHVSGDSRDILYAGGPRDWDNLTIDPGNDDYYDHADPGCEDLRNSLFWLDDASEFGPCNPTTVTIDMNTNGGVGVGTAGDDVILGTAGADRIDGLGGNDIICAGSGDDEVQGGPGEDEIHGGDGADRLFGAQGADEIRGGGGDDTIHGNRGNDLLYGDEGDDRIFGYADDDVLFGGTGNDRLHGNFGDDEIDGGDGADRLFGYGDNDRLSGGNGNDLMGGNFGDDLLDGDNGADRMYGSDGADTVRGGEGDDTVDGNSGNDLVQGGPGQDALDGGIGFDSCDGGSGVDSAGRCEIVSAVP